MNTQKERRERKQAKQKHLKETRKAQFSIVLKVWLTPKDVELEFDIATGTQANLRSQGLIPYHKRGNIVRYKRDDLDEWFETAKVV